MELLIGTLVLGISVGSIYALAATGLVLTYKTSGILNLGFGSLALLLTFIHWQFTDWGVPVWLAAALVLLVVAPLVGVFLDTQLFRRIEGQPQVIAVIATVGLFVLIQGIVSAVWGGRTEFVPSLFPTRSVTVPGGIVLGLNDIGVFVVAALAAGGLAAMLRYTRLGVSFRAVVNNRSVAGLMGVNTAFVSGFAWALGSSFAALTGILLTQGGLLDPLFLPSFVIAFVLGAAIVGYLQSLPLAMLGGLGLGIAQSLIIQYLGVHGFIGRVRDGLPFIAITIAVLLAPKALRAGSLTGSFIVRTRETVSVATAGTRFGVAGVVLGGLAIFALFASNSQRITIASGLIFSVVFVSLVILTGYSGQISLGHTAFMGIAAFSAGHIVMGLGWSPWVAMPLGALAAVPAGALIGFIAVRLHGLYLALMTLAFAFMAHQLFFEERRISGGEGGVPLPRPTGATSDLAFFYLVFAVLVAVSLLAVSLRTGRTGRVLAAMRDSETASRSLGIAVTRYKVLIFGLSAMIAGFGGVLQAMMLQSANKLDFLPFWSLIYVTLAVVGGIFHVGGAIAIGVLYGVAQQFEALGGYQLILFGLGASLALANNPEGLFGELRRGGNALLRMLQRDRTPEGTPAPVTGAQR